MKSSFWGNNKNESLANISIHAYTVYMQKLQILFPEPQLNKLRGIAKQEDRPVSELVRSAVDFWLSRHGEDAADNVSEAAPIYHCGDILVESDKFRDLANDDRNHL